MDLLLTNSIYTSYKLIPLNTKSNLSPVNNTVGESNDNILGNSIIILISNELETVSNKSFVICNYIET
jgi:hypothetical protein